MTLKVSQVLRFIGLTYLNPRKGVESMRSRVAWRLRRMHIHPQHRRPCGF